MIFNIEYSRFHHFIFKNYIFHVNKAHLFVLENFSDVQVVKDKGLERDV